MPQSKNGPAQPDRKALDVEIARLRELDVGALRARWHTVLGRRPPPHLPRHLLFRILAYRLQADLLGDLDAESQRLLDRSESPEKAGQRAVARRSLDVRPGTVLGREWNGQMQQVTVLENGFAWRGKTYPSLSKIAHTVECIATRERCSIRKVNMTISLAFLAPNLVKAAIEGRLPRGMGVARLVDAPAEWSRQFQMLGLTAL